jgi:hypothetical protein
LSFKAIKNKQVINSLRLPFFSNKLHRNGSVTAGFIRSDAADGMRKYQIQSIGYHIFFKRFPRD